jgi:hypothetical protein
MCAETGLCNFINVGSYLELFNSEHNRTHITIRIVLFFCHIIMPVRDDCFIEVLQHVAHSG